MKPALLGLTIAAFFLSAEGQAVQLVSEYPLVPLKFVTFPAGSFTMGSPATERARLNDEDQHQVVLTHSFEIQVTPLTQQQWYDVVKEIPNSNPGPSYFSRFEFCPTSFISLGTGVNGLCPNHPVEEISWEEAVWFANQLSSQKGLKPCYTLGSKSKVEPNQNIYECKGYRLPTEAEWEYAARAGTTTIYPFGEEETYLSKFSIYRQNNPGPPTEPWPADVASLDPNPKGLYDVQGNIQQWVFDIYQRFSNKTATDPQGPFLQDGGLRVLRGGAFSLRPESLRSASRDSFGQTRSSAAVGFRLVRTIGAQQ